MAIDSANNTSNVSEYWGLVYRLRQAKASGYLPLHVVGNCAIVLSQRRMHHPPRKPHLKLLVREARVLDDDIGVSSWGHHYRAYKTITDRLENIDMDIGASIQEHASSEANIVEAATSFLDNDVNYWVWGSHAA